MSLAGGVANRRWAAVGRGKAACAAVLLCAATATVVAAQSFKTLSSFDSADGAAPQAGLVQATNGNFYGTASFGGANGGGAVFEITPAGTLTTLYSFCLETNCTDGANPNAGLVQATNGNFYGPACCGGANGGGTVFEITAAGALTTLYNFCLQTNCTDGEFPNGLVQTTNGNFYGTTLRGGASGSSCYTDGGCGTVFEITPEGKLTTLYNFCSQTNCTDGFMPFAGLVQASNGNFYGTTAEGGDIGNGTVFEITPAGKLTTIHSFGSQAYDGAGPSAGLTQAADGNLYGTTSSGGANGGGTVFEITPAGTLTTLYSFCSQTKCTDGLQPAAGLVQASDGNFFGTTPFGGAGGGCGIANGCGTLFEVTPAGRLSTLHNFCSQANCTDGYQPFAGLVQATSGNFYGTASLGGDSSNCYRGCGTVFGLSVGLGPFVEMNPTLGKAGAKVTVLGNDLTGTTSVSFSGTAASFTVNSRGTAIFTTVPSSATTGYLQVTTPSGTLKSNLPFTVRH